jgi:7-cyano-7-deazaguanine reductase
LKSNCKVTGQPDWGNIFIAYKAAHTIEPSSLLKYLISFRGENHFHEEIVETVYKRLYDLLAPEELTVVAFYTRRGGIDINPCRTTDLKLIPSEFPNPSILLQGHFRQ